MKSAALRGRAKLATLLNNLLHRASQGSGRPDPGNVRMGRQFVLGVIAKGSPRLITAAPAASWRKATSVKSTAMVLGYFLGKAQFPLQPFATRLVEAAGQNPGTRAGGELPRQGAADHRRRRGCQAQPGERQGGRGMQQIGRVWKTQAKARKKTRGAAGKKAAGQTRKGVTTSGYGDIWAGAVVPGKQLLPLAQQLLSSNHPKLKSPNRREEAVRFQSLGGLGRLGLEATAVGDRALGRKELVIRLASQGRTGSFGSTPTSWYRSLIRGRR